MEEEKKTVTQEMGEGEDMKEKRLLRAGTVQMLSRAGIIS